MAYMKEHILLRLCVKTLYTAASFEFLGCIGDLTAQLDPRAVLPDKSN